MRALITGATGFIGSRLVANWVQSGDEVHAIVRATSATARLSALIGSENVHVYDESVDSLLRAVSRSKPEIVVHLASSFFIQHTKEQVPRLIESNILFGTMLLEAMAANSVTRFLNTGSFWQHYGSEDYNPANLYAATKKAFEDILKYYTEATQLKAVTLELPDTFGPNDPRRKIISILVESVRDQRPLDLTPGGQQMDLVHVDDVVNAFRVAARLVESQASHYSVYSVSSGRAVTLAELVSYVNSVIGKTGNLHLGKRPYRFREVMTVWQSGAPLPGWCPTRSIEDFFADQLGSVPRNIQHETQTD
jgi:nucleoside-diphosphate-sugar epimerase